MSTDSARPKGLFLNCAKANCSIYESGKMAYQCLTLSDRYSLGYREISASDHSFEKHDFYIFNYHHATMNWLNTKSLRSLSGLKSTLVLETLPNNPFALCPPNDFDIYCALDPTMDIDDRRVYAFPRPLEIPVQKPVHTPNDIPVIGTFGFATPGKGFELVVDAVNREFEKAVIRINIPAGTYADKGTQNLQNQNYAQYLANLCRKVAQKGIEVVVTDYYMTKEELIHWCAANTLNCFLYNRIQPGLAATTDQAISSGRPLIVSANETFRHIHDYLRPYPLQSLSQAIATSTPKVLEMQQAWSPINFARRFEEVLEDQGLLVKTPRKNIRKHVTRGKKDPVLIVNHGAQQCGIAQYGKNLAASLSTSNKYDITLASCTDAQTFITALGQRDFKAVIYNYYPTTMPWLTQDVTRQLDLPQLGIMHEVTQASADAASQDLFDFHLCPDPTLVETNPFAIRTKRLIPPYINLKPQPRIVTIGSFGFGFGNKGFERLVERVQEEFDEAIIVLHMPFNDIVDSDGESHALATADRCHKTVHKPGIKLAVNHKFLKKQQILDLLASMTLNVFLYDRDRELGISSVVEMALAVQRPVALSRCGMFRHMFGADPSIFVEDNSLLQIIENGIAPLIPFYNEWCETAFVADYERILDKVLGKSNDSAIVPPPHRPVDRENEIEKHQMDADSESQRPVSVSAVSDNGDPVPSDMGLTGTFNRILDDGASLQYAPIIKRMKSLVPDMMASKSAAAHVHYAFVMSTVEKFAAYHVSPRILSVGSPDDAAAAALIKVGYQVETIDLSTRLGLDASNPLPETSSGGYDIVFSTSVLERVPDETRFVSQLLDLLSPGGVCILIVSLKNCGDPENFSSHENRRYFSLDDIQKSFLADISNCSMVDHPAWCSQDTVHEGSRCATIVVQKNHSGSADGTSYQRQSPSTDPKTKIVFFHIPKTGGATLHQLLCPNFQTDTIYPERGSSHERFNGEDMEAYKLISGHFTADQCRKIPDKKVVFTLLRDPKQRLLSHYYFLKSHRKEFILNIGYDMEALLSKELDLFSFLTDERIRNSPLVDNVMTRYLSDAELINPSGRIQNEELVVESAKRRIDALDGICILEHFHDSLRLLFSMLGLPLPSTIDRHMSFESLTTYSHCEPVEREKITIEIDEALDALTHLDRQVYLHALKRFVSAMENAQ